MKRMCLIIRNDGSFWDPVRFQDRDSARSRLPAERRDLVLVIGFPVCGERDLFCVGDIVFFQEGKCFFRGSMIARKGLPYLQFP